MRKFMTNGSGRGRFVNKHAPLRQKTCCMSYAKPQTIPVRIIIANCAGTLELKLRINPLQLRSNDELYKFNNLDQLVVRLNVRLQDQQWPTRNPKTCPSLATT